MAKVRHLAEGSPLPEWFLDELQEFLSTYVSPNFKVTILNPTTLQVVAGAGNAQVAAAIGNPSDTTKFGWRWNAATVTVAAPGGLVVGENDVFITAYATSYGAPGTPPPAEIDTTTSLAFGLSVLAPGSTPTGSAAVAWYRRVATATWNGAAFTAVTHLVGAAGGAAGGLRPGALESSQAWGLSMVEGVLPGHGAGDVQTDPQLALKVGAPSAWGLPIAAGYALVQGDDGAQQGLYYAVQDSPTTLTMATHEPATNPRVDAIVARWNDPAFTTRTPPGQVAYEQVVGTPTGGADLTNLNGAPGKAGGPAFPPSALLLAYVLVRTSDTGGPIAGNVLDQRRLAGPAIWGEDGKRYRLGIDGSGILGVKAVYP